VLCLNKNGLFPHQTDTAATEWFEMICTLHVRKDTESWAYASRGAKRLFSNQVRCHWSTDQPLRNWSATLKWQPHHCSLPVQCLMAVYPSLRSLRHLKKISVANMLEEDSMGESQNPSTFAAWIELWVVHGTMRLGQRVYISLECGRVVGGLRRHGERARALGA
jgi:hypothetical protein